MRGGIPELLARGQRLHVEGIVGVLGGRAEPLVKANQRRKAGQALVWARAHQRPAVSTSQPMTIHPLPEAQELSPRATREMVSVPAGHGLGPIPFQLKSPRLPRFQVLGTTVLRPSQPPRTCRREGWLFPATLLRFCSQGTGRLVPMSPEHLPPGSRGQTL